MDKTFPGCDTLIFDDRFSRLWQVVGNTPMIKLCYRFNGKTSFIYVKCEQFNPSGSIKDRIALYILEQAYKRGQIFPGYKIIEASSGNTGISFATIGRALGHKVKIFMPDWLSKERRDILKCLGAEVVLISKEQGGFLESIRQAELLAQKTEQSFLPRQFENALNPEAHEKTTGPEIWSQLQLEGLEPHAFIAGVGTGGTVMGVGRCLKNRNKDVKIFPLEPEESPTMSIGKKTGEHRIQGISDEFIPAIVRLDELDNIIQCSDGDAILMARRLAAQLGLSVGISSGANIVGAIKIKEELGLDACVVTLFPDCNRKYLSTDLMRNEQERPGYISPYVDFIGYQPVSKINVCHLIH